MLVGIDDIFDNVVGFDVEVLEGEEVDNYELGFRINCEYYNGVVVLFYICFDNCLIVSSVINFVIG